VFSRLVFAAISLFFCLLLQVSGLIPRFTATTLDTLFQIRGPRATSQSVVIVAVDDESLQKIGPWPFPRSIHAALLDRLQQAKGVAFDILFPDRSPDDRLLATRLQKPPPAVVAVAENVDGNKLSPNSSFGPNIRQGHIQTILGSDGIIRKVELCRQQTPTLAGALLEIVGMANGCEKRGGPPQLINFYGPEFSFLYLSYNDVLQGRIAAEFFRGRLVLVGIEAKGLGDVHITPFSIRHPTPGVEIQATILNNLLDDGFIRPLPYISWGLALILFLFGIAFWPQRSETGNLLLTAISAGLLCFLAILLFSRNLFFDPVWPLLVLFSTYLCHLIVQGIWLTFRLIANVRGLDEQLERGLQQIYTTIPARLTRARENAEKYRFLPGGIARHISQMQEGIHLLSLQNHFIEHLLSRETPPLILWEKPTGRVVLANASFNLLWPGLGREKDSNLPQLQDFFNFIDRHRLDGNTLPEGLPASDCENPENTDKVIDISIPILGRSMYYRVFLHPVQSADIDFSGVMAVLTDVTEVRELERLQAEVMNILSHELRLPLTAILGYGELLADRVGHEEKRYAEEICSQGRRLNTLIDDFLDISRLESGRYRLHHFPVNMITVIEDAVNAISPAAAKKGIAVNLRLPAKATPVSGDESLLLQATINLLDNAVKFSPPQTTISIELIEEEAQLRLLISDQGPGISPEERQTVFAKFARGASQQDHEGFGLGLSLVKQVIDGHGGDIAITGEEGAGTTFIVSLTKIGH
jgi:signal transduction histidine kinase/CHASE2 domain-containing sensor protein